MRTLLWLLAASLAFAVSAESQVVSSDPEFMASGTKPYGCVSPNGRNVVCNKWLFVSKRGWRKSCTPAGVSVLSRLSNPEDSHIMLGEDYETRQCVALFDEAWTDFRRVNIKNKKAQERELTRELRPSEFHQFVEITESGTYELSSCMVREVLQASPNAEDGLDFSNHGGINVSLIQWQHNSVSSPIYHIMLPENKARFGEGGTLQGAQHFDQIVGSYEEAPETATPGTVVGIPPIGKPTADAYVYNVAGIWAHDGHHRDLYYVDGYDGHAGLENKYAGGGYNTDFPDGSHHFNAEWSCYSAATHIDPGFYVLSAEIKPTFLYSGGTEYFGFGAIKHIALERVD